MLFTLAYKSCLAAKSDLSNYTKLFHISTYFSTKKRTTGASCRRPFSQARLSSWENVPSGQKTSPSVAYRDSFQGLRPFPHASASRLFYYNTKKPPRSCGRFFRVLDRV